MMMEGNLEYDLRMKAVEEIIWKSFDIIKGELESEDFSFLLFMLSLQKEAAFRNIEPQSLPNIKDEIRDCIAQNSGPQSKKYLELHDSVFKLEVNKLSASTLALFINKLAEIDRDFLVKNFSAVFDKVLYKLSKSHGRYSGQFIIPQEISRFIGGLAELSPNSKVFNPFAGVASFGVFLDQGHDYYGQELNKKNWALGTLRLMAYEKPSTSKYVCEDSILSWPDQSEKFDLIVANPPLALRLDHQYRDNETESRTIEHFLIEKGVHSLKQNGKLIALIPQGFLYRMQEKRLREYLVEKDLIDTIISLPGGLLLDTGIPLIILVISRTKKLPGKVRFIDAKQFVEAKSPREKVLNDQKLLNHIQGIDNDNFLSYPSEVHEPISNYNSDVTDQNNDTDVERIIEISKLSDFDYNLNVARYFQKQIDGVKLGDILELVRGQRGNLPDTGKLIRIRDLKDDKVDFTLDISELEEAELRRPDIHLVSESCLLLALRWRTLKPTLFEYKGEPIFRSPDILSFKVNEAIADKAYIINELHADYVQEQLDSYRIGTSMMPSIRNADLMEVVIKLPSLEEQRRKINNVFQETLFKEKDKIAFIRKVFNEELGVKQHNIRQHLKNVKDSLDTLLDYMGKKEGILNKEDVINPNRNVTVGKRFDKMYSSLENVIEEINTLTNEQSFSLSEPIDLIYLITASVDEIIHPNFDVALTKDEVGILGTELDKLMIIFSAKELKELINNVVENAVRHGFTAKDKFYKIVFDISVDEETAILTIKNNGVPFPKNISSHIGVKGKKAGKFANQGIGAWKIVQSIEHYGHEYEIIDEPESEFPVGWIFKFKLITE